MSASTMPSPLRPNSARRFVGRALLIMAVVLLAALAGLSLWFYRAAHHALPQLDGAIHTPGLQSEVSVLRDPQGVPHIQASSLEDLFFAQGYVTAQDRLWQMDMTRRLVAGDAAEILPRSSGNWVKRDKQQRLLRLRAVSERVAQQLPDRDRSFFAAYARGVNAYIEQHQDNLPVEFRVLGYKPKPWTVTDSVIVGLGMSELLNPQFEMEYRREEIGEHLPPELMADLYPPSSWRDHAPGSDNAIEASPAAPKGPRKTAMKNGGPLLPMHRSNPDCESCLPGSNNWVVSGAHTTTGKPLLSNDMHLPHRVPGVWYEVQLHAQDFNVEGFSLPGMPFVIVGHNQRIAWGFTNLNPDVQDLFIENFNSSGEYQTPSGWEKPAIAHEVIHVKDAPDVHMDVTITRHGPVISELFPGEQRRIALQWLIYDEKAIGIPLFELDSASNWQEFRNALSHFATPSQNVVYADVDGNIGYQAMGFVPVRRSGDGTLPEPGADGQHDWTGYLPFDKLPSVYNPPSGIIATANSKITPDNYPYLLATQWFPPYRVERIYHVLQSDKKFSPADMLKLQTDVFSDYDQLFADRFVYAIDHDPKAGARAKQAADLMRGFDGRMSKDSVAATIEVNARKELWELLLKPQLGKSGKDYEWSEMAVSLENIIEKQPARWLPRQYANFNELLTAAVEKGIEHAPSNLRTWKYGTQFPVEINHPLFGAIPILSRWAGPGRKPQSGGGYTVKQVGRGFGPSERMTVDFSNLDNSTYNIVMGESGQIFSPYYMDQWKAWYGNTTYTLPYSDEAVARARSHQLRLLPAGQ